MNKLIALGAILLIPLLIVSFERKSAGYDSKIKNFIQGKSTVVNTIRKIGSKIKRELGSQKVGNICFGEDDYLFYCTQDDGNIFQNLLSNQNQQPKNLELDKFLQAENVYFIVVPNKSRVFSNKLKLPHIDKINWGKYQVMDNYFSSKFDNRYLGIEKNNGFLKNQKHSYYKTDSHWTMLGAHASLSYFDLPEVDSDSFDSAFKTQAPFRGDLLTRLNNSFQYPREIEDKEFYLAKEKILNESDMAKHQFTLKNPLKSGKVLLIGDSFRINFAEVLHHYFGEVDVVMNKKKLKLSEFNPKDYQYIFLISVERYLFRVIK